MAPRRGILLLDLIPDAPGSSVIPADVAERLGALAVLEYQATTTPQSFIYHGVLAPVSDLAGKYLPGLRDWPVQIPGLNAGIPFQLVVKRAPPSSDDALEPAPSDWRLDLILDRIAITIPGLRPAVRVEGSGTTATHLVADPSVESVRIVGSGVFRIAETGGNLDVRFVDRVDPLDPDAEGGPVFRLTFEPPHFFIGGSDIGVTVDRLTYDDSSTFTPPEIVARHHDASWRGISIKEATVYLPRNTPVIGDLSAGVRDVLLGSPAGMQGSVQIELGQTPVDPATISFFRDGEDSPLPVSGTGEARVVTLPGGTDGRFRVRAVLNGGGTAQWYLPDGRVETATATSVFSAHDGDILKVRGREVVDGEPRLSPTTTFRFVEASASAPPQVTASRGSTTWRNVIFVSGTAAELRRLSFGSSPGRDDVTWQFGEGAGASTGTGPTFSPAIPDDPGRYALILKDAQGRPRRVEVEVLARGGLIVGTEEGVRDLSGPVSVRAVEATYEAAPFHQGGDRVHAGRAAQVTGGTVTVPTGTFAAVTLERVVEAGGSDAPAPPREETLPLRQVQVLMEFARTDIRGWGEKRPAGATAFSAAALLDWMNSFPAGTRFIMVGRTDDIDDLATNRRLARDRAERLYNMLPQELRDRTLRRGEHDPAVPGEESIDYAPEAGHVGWLIQDTETLPQGSDPEAPPRPRYRRVDVYALAPASAAPGQETLPNPSDRLPELRRALLPGPDGAAPARPAPAERRTPYRVRLVVEWDSPTVVEWADAIPTRAELLVAWQKEPLRLPTEGGSDTIDLDGPSVFELLLRWSYDARSGETVLHVAWENQGFPEGLFSYPETPNTPGNILAVALGLGPALSAFLDAAGVDNGAARIGALLGAAAVATPFARNGKVIVHKVSAEGRQRRIDSLEGVRFRALVDYTVHLGFEVSAGPIQIRAAKPMKVKYRNVGVEFDDSKSGVEKLGLVYEDAAFDIADPGQWEIAGPLGDLLRVNAVRSGSGSTWMELDLAFGLDLGVIRVSGATIRLTFHGGALEVSLRGLAASVTVPGTLKGAGAMAVGQDGTLSAGLDVEVIPAKVQVRGDLDINPAVGFVNLGILVKFAVGLPLANTGLGVFGFAGRFVSNGTRNFTNPSPDPIQQEINWWLQPIQKYRPERGQWALGVGAFVGTLPDTAFTFAALGMLVVEFPRPTVIFGIDARFASPPSGGATETGGSTGNLLGMIVVDSTAVKIGIRGSYAIPKLLELQVPISAYFPYNRSVGSYVRIGCDGFQPEGRHGDPVTVKILPGLLDLTAWAYLMIEEKKLHRLGGSDINLDGFSIGFGSGAGVRWTAGPIELSASVRILVGLGVKPLMLVGSLFVEGRLHLVVVSISARGHLTLELTENFTRLHGKFCGEVDLFFFSLKGCVGFSIESGPGVEIPEPPSPLTGIDLTDRFGRVTGEAKPAGKPTTTVWPDTVPVLQFKQYMNPDLSGSAFVAWPSTGIPTPHKWAGTTELKYAFKLTSVELRPKGGPALAGPLDAAWWLPTHRSGLMPGADHPPATPASEHEGRQLALLAWHPAPWASNLPDGGEGTEADPAVQTSRICETVLQPVPACVLGQNGRLEAPGRPVFTQEQAAPGPFPSSFRVHGREGLPDYEPAELAALLADSGSAYIPGGVRTLPAPFTFADGTTVDRVWEIARVDQSGRPAATLPFEGKLAPALYRGQLTLSVCHPSTQEPPSRTICHDYAGLKLAPTDDSFKIGEVAYTSLNQRAPGLSDRYGTGTPQLLVSPAGIEIDPPQTASRVSVEVVPISTAEVRLEAYDAAGKLVGQAESNRDQKLQTLVVLASNIDRVRVRQAEEGCAINRFCYTPAATLSTAPLRDSFPLTHLSQSLRTAAKLPEVFGVRPDGKEEPWKPVPENGSPFGCTLITYHAPAGSWVAFRIRPFPGARLGLVRVCGVTEEAHTYHGEEQQTRDDLRDAFGQHGDARAPLGRPLLEAGTEYEIVVRYKWAGWRKTDDQPAPPALTDALWAGRPEKTEVYHFHTARWAAPTADPIDFYDESRFDARMLARYIVKMEPDGTTPHFLDDPIRVHWAVDYPDGLLNKYGRKLVLRLRRTDQKPGALAGATHPADEPILIAWSTLHFPYQSLADQRIREAAFQAPCLSDTHLGGASASIQARLAPRAEYDLLVLAQSQANPDDEVLIAVSHFRTSAYANPAELIASLGLSGDPAEPSVVPPLEVLLPGSAALPPVPAGPPELSDALFEEALRGLGLDPWPLPRGGRTVLLWQRAGARWHLAGVLVETDEPLLRKDRLRVGTAQVGVSQLIPAIANAAATRILYRSTSPAPVESGAALRLDFVATEPRTGPGTPASISLSAAAAITTHPRILAQEGLL